MLCCWSQTSVGSQTWHRSRIWGWSRRLSTLVWLSLGHRSWPLSSGAVRSSRSRKKCPHWKLEVREEIRDSDSPPYIHPVALPSHRGDGPVQASFHLPPDEGVTAVDGHNIWSWSVIKHKDGDGTELNILTLLLWLFFPLHPLHCCRPASVFTNHLLDGEARGGCWLVWWHADH